MEKSWIIGIAILIFLVVTFIYWRITRHSIKKIYGENWKIWGARTFYWQDAIYICTAITILILFIFKWTNVLSF